MLKYVIFYLLFRSG